MKTFTDLFIRRPVLALVVSLVIVIADLQAISSLNVRQYPRSDIASVTVTTVYVGASADLVRGFITTPLERAIAAADGIDYLQSQSSQGLSTITARLKLNYDSNKALSEISSKVNQVRGDLPPEAEIPVINIESADSHFASAYLSFTSDILQANEITDYLNRIVQPRLTALGGVQRAEILGGRTFAMRIWLKPEQMAALNVSPAQVRQALADNNFLSAVGSTKGSLVQVDLTANTDLHSVDDFKNLVIRQENGTLVRLGDVADVVLGAEDYNTEVRFSGQRAVFMGIFVLPNANSIDVDQTRPHRDGTRSRRNCPPACRADRLRRHGLHQHRDPRCFQHADGDAPHRHDRDLPVPRLVALGHHPDRRDPDLAHRRGFPHAGFWVHAESAHSAGDRAFGRSRRRRRHRGGGKRRAPFARRADARSTPRCWARANSSARSSP